MGGEHHPHRPGMTPMRWMHLRLRAPLAAFGGEAIDARGIIRDFPAQSMLTGLLGNALGWTRGMRAEHRALQGRIVFGALWERETAVDGRMTDYQTASIHKDDQAWTTHGAPAGRAGGAATYAGSHQRWRDYHADLHLSVVLRLDPDDVPPIPDEIADALIRPARPLFIGRKSCLPSAPIFAGWIAAPSILAALDGIAPADATDLRAFWPASEGTEGAVRTTDVTDERNWTTGLHGGARRVCEGRIAATGNGG